MLDGAAPFYDTYRCSDDRYVAVAPLEGPFFAAMASGVGLILEPGYDHTDPAGWPKLRSRLTEIFLTRTRDEWAERFAGTDACVTPVLTFAEAAAHPHLAARSTLVEIDGVVQPAPAPRFSRTPAATPRPAPNQTTPASAVLEGWSQPGA